ncbi:adenosine receptor A2a-like [Heptranchias perlo]|uniref:adenosine receptor A2a-like n=1 Tax=Heptranchias perlo TaxID=212740 RepID=UPI0035594F18
MLVTERQSLENVIYIVFELVIAVLAVLGNVLVCWAVYLNSNLQNVTNFFVVSLAVADIAVGVLAIPFAITISTGFCSLFYGCLFIACFVLVLTQSSIFSLLAIAIDRYIAIKIPLRYNSLVTGQRARGIICICWVLSFMIGLTPMLGWNKSNCNKVKMNETITCRDGMVSCLFEEVVTMDYMVYYNFFACVLIPLLIMFGIYLRIFMAARHQLKQMDFKIIHTEKTRSTLQKEVHAAKSLAIIVGLFAVCWLPLHIINCVNLFCGNCRPPAWIMYFAIILSHANSVVNPLIYAYRIREFRQTFRKILKRHVLRKTDQAFKNQNTRSSIHTNGVGINVHINGYPLDRLNTCDVEKTEVVDKDIHQNGHIRDLQPNGTIPGAHQNEQLLDQNGDLLEDQVSSCCDVHLNMAFLQQTSCMTLTEVS